MKNFLSFAATFIFALSLAGPLRADVDYPCLNACAAKGSASRACLAQCSNDRSADQSAGQSTPQTHTDYRCIDLCIHGGKPASSCMSRCSYSAGAPAQPNADLSAHDVLQPLVPAGDTILPPRDKTSKPQAAKDYKCIQQCLRDGMDDQLCNQNCAGVTPEFETTGQ